jgi:pyruvate dehydrogenase E2 component (dihydrolipoamide acetyltransferase)
MTVELKLPELGENIDAAQVVKILVAVGDAVVKDQPVIEVETGKATIEVPSSITGRVTALKVAEGETIKVGQVILELDEAQVPLGPANAAAIAEVARPAPVPPTPEAAPAPVAATAVATSSAAAPHVRQFAREIGVDIASVRGAGPGGRISLEDVKRHARDSAAAPRPAGTVPAEPPLPDFSHYGSVERKPLSTVRQLTAEAMLRAWNGIPHVMLEAEADVTELEAFRQNHKGRVEAAGGKLTVTAMIVKVVAAALRAFPSFNASFDASARELVLKRYVHIGVATDTPRGLLVPVVRDVDQKTLVQLGVEILQLAEKARAGRLSPAEMQGGCFSVTNLGGMGIDHFTAVINSPEVAILAVGRASMRPLWDGGGFKPRLMLPLSLSLDHRVNDGADGARFLSFVVEAIEQPFLLAL